jgi:hypothetical protein
LLKQVGNVIQGVPSSSNITLSAIFQAGLSKDIAQHCCICRGRVNEHVIFGTLPALIALQMLHIGEWVLNFHRSICVSDIDGNSGNYTLVGIIYFGNSHFSLRFIDSNGQCWFHDGMIGNSEFILEKPFSLMAAAELMTCQGKLPGMCVLRLSN